MGQPITVIEKPSSNPAVLRFETNRPLSGMGHERYTEAPAVAPPLDEADRTPEMVADTADTPAAQAAEEPAAADPPADEKVGQAAAVDAPAEPAADAPAAEPAAGADA